MEYIIIISLNFFNINILDFYIFSFLEDLFVLCMIYNFFKLLLLGLLCEVIWPTQFFNRRNFIGTTNIRKRVYSEVLNKFYRNVNISKYVIQSYMGLCL